MRSLPWVVQEPAAYLDCFFLWAVNSPQTRLPRYFLGRQLLPKPLRCCSKFGYPGLQQLRPRTTAATAARPNPLRSRQPASRAPAVPPPVAGQRPLSCPPNAVRRPAPSDRTALPASFWLVPLPAVLPLPRAHWFLPRAGLASCAARSLPQGWGGPFRNGPSMATVAQAVRGSGPVPAYERRPRAPEEAWREEEAPPPLFLLARRSVPPPAGLRHVAGAGGAGAAGRAGGPGCRLLRQHRRARWGVLPGAGALRHEDGAHLRGGGGGLPGHRRGGEEGRRRGGLTLGCGCRAEGEGCPGGRALRAGCGGGEAVAAPGSAREGSGVGALWRRGGECRFEGGWKTAREVWGRPASSPGLRGAVSPSVCWTGVLPGLGGWPGPSGRRRGASAKAARRFRCCCGRQSSCFRGRFLEVFFVILLGVGLS